LNDNSSSKQPYEPEQHIRFQGDERQILQKERKRECQRPLPQDAWFAERSEEGLDHEGFLTPELAQGERCPGGCLPIAPVLQRLVPRFEGFGQTICTISGNTGFFGRVGGFFIELGLVCILIEK